MAAWLEALAAAEREAQPAVLVTVLAAKGSTPREAGAKMVVSGRRAGRHHWRRQPGIPVRNRRRALAGNRRRRALDAGLSARSGVGPVLRRPCDGAVRGAAAARLHIGLFGAGHVGKALVEVLAELPCRVHWIDARPEALPASLPPNILPVRMADPAQAVAALPPGCMAIVMTHDHALDFEIVVAALHRTDLLAVGLIGSATKRARFVSRLERMGIDPAKLICPIGLPGIEGKQPAVVAVSVAAQILQTQSALAESQAPCRLSRKLAAIASAHRHRSGTPLMAEADHMRRAIALSLEMMRSGRGGPFGAVIVKDGRIVAEGFNQVTSTNDPTAHAEVVAVRLACQALGTFDLTGCEIYTSCEPCPMCLSAIYWARLGRIYYANDRYDAAKIGFRDDFLYHEIPLPLDQRAIPTSRLLQAEGWAAFEEWDRKPDKIQYQGHGHQGGASREGRAIGRCVGWPMMGICHDSCIAVRLAGKVRFWPAFSCGRRCPCGGRGRLVSGQQEGRLRA